MSPTSRFFFFFKVLKRWLRYTCVSRDVFDYFCPGGEFEYFHKMSMIEIFQMLKLFFNSEWLQKVEGIHWV